MHACLLSATSELRMKVLRHVRACQPPGPGAKQTSVAYKCPSLWNWYATESDRGNLQKVSHK